MNENSAAALFYAIERTDNTTHSVIFYNLGAYNLQVTLAEFLAVNDTQSKKLVESVKIFADYSIPNVGGLKYDLIIANHFAETFDALKSRQGKKSIKTTPKFFLKLLKAANKYKEILSANKEALVQVEGLNDGEDFFMTLHRSTLEELCRNEFSQLVSPIEKVLMIANRTKQDVTLVELIGGAVRMPKVQ